MHIKIGNYKIPIKKKVDAEFYQKTINTCRQMKTAYSCALLVSCLVDVLRMPFAVVLNLPAKYSHKKRRKYV